MQIEIYSDLVCPWCYIGRKRFEAALALRPEVHPDVRWLPFELNPHLDERGVDRATYLAAKFGDAAQLEAMQRHIQEIGTPLGIAFRFDLIRRTPNTRAAHALLAFAAESGRQDATMGALFRAYFEEGVDIGDPKSLVAIGAAQDLDESRIRGALADRRHYAQILAHEQQAQQWGISGVPTFIFDRRYAISGAQEPQMFLQVFDRLRAAA